MERENAGWRRLGHLLENNGFSRGKSGRCHKKKYIDGLIRGHGKNCGCTENQRNIIEKKMERVPEGG
jgi:hypothetical protein